MATGALLRSSARTVSGAVTKSAVVGSSLEFFELGPSGFAINEIPVATGVTDDTGGFSVQVPMEAGALLIVARGGSYIEMLLMTEDGLEVLSKLDRRLIVIESS